MSHESGTDRLAIQDVMLDYAAAVDERDIKRYRACFTDDVEVVGFGTRTYNGRDDWVGYVWEALQNYGATQHMLGPVLADLHGDEAQARTDVQAVHFLAEGDARFTLWATYRTALRRDAGEWRICRHELLVTGTSTD